MGTVIGAIADGGITYTNQPTMLLGVDVLQIRLEFQVNFNRISMDYWTNSTAQGLMNTRSMILLIWISILCHILVEIMCYSNLVLISPNQPKTSTPRSIHRQCLVPTRYTRDQLINMSRQLESSKYCTLPHTTINTVKQLKINKCPSKLGARHIKSVAK